MKSAPIINSVKKNILTEIEYIKKDLYPELRNTFSSLIKDKYLLLIILIGIANRLYYINQPLKYNESFTFINYINQANPIRTIWYSVANNHVLSTILIKLSTRPKKRVGSDEIWDKSEKSLIEALNNKGLDQWELTEKISIGNML